MKTGSDILASAAGLVHQHFDPGGIEIRHGDDADTGNMVNSIIEGNGPLVMVPGEPIVMKSTKARAATSSASTARGGDPAPRPKKFWVDTFEDAPVFASPTDIRLMGTLKRGTNYVFGKARGREIRVGPAFNHFWLKTDPDTGSGHGVSAFYLTRWGTNQAKDNTGQVIPTRE